MEEEVQNAKLKSKTAIMIDNYDSFVYNIVQYLGKIGLTDLEVIRNNEITVDEVIAKKPDYIFLSPGPSDPNHAGICLDLLKALKEKPIPMFGVCLGHQCLGQVFGGKIVQIDEPIHGKTSSISHDSKGVFKTLPNPLIATRYHSLVVERETLPDCFEVSATSKDKAIMAMRHSSLPFESVQFHPESVLTEHGLKIIRNFCEQYI